MTFSLQTLTALLAASALALTCVRSPIAGGLLMVFVIPISMMLIGITSPQRGTQLDPSNRWYLFVLAKTWAFTLAGLVLLAILFSASPYLSDRLVRGIRGDFRSNRITIIFPGESSLSQRLKGKRLRLHDSRGFVGEVRDFDCWETLQNGRLINSRIWLLVSTDRKDALELNGREFKVEIKPDGVVQIIDSP